MCNGKGVGGRNAAYIDRMNRRFFLLAQAATFGLTLPAFAADEISLRAISDYLNAMTTVKSAFTQINPDGTISTGTLYIKRPGQMRFDYDLPDPALVIAAGGVVAIFDRKSNEPPQQVPLKRTPLSVILEETVDLTRANMITGHSWDDKSTTITAQDPENPDIGHIDLRFTPDPVELRQWVITDEAGSQTTVILGDTEGGLTLSATLFSIHAQIRGRSDRR